MVEPSQGAFSAGIQDTQFLLLSVGQLCDPRLWLLPKQQMIRILQIT